MDVITPCGECISQSVCRIKLLMDDAKKAIEDKNRYFDGCHEYFAVIDVLMFEDCAQAVMTCKEFHQR